MQDCHTIPNSPFHAKRIAWVTPDYPPDPGGVSDHSSEMVNALRSAGHEVLVCSRPHERSFAALDLELSAYSPDLIVVAYTPLAYAPHTGGIAPAFTRWSMGLRRRLGCQAILLAHETNLPLNFHWGRRGLKLAALAVTQVAQFSILAASFDCVLFSNAGTQSEWGGRLSGLADRFHTIRICSNIPYHPSLVPATDLTNSGRYVPTPTVLFFGTGHESVLFDYVEEAFTAITRTDPKAGLVIIGISSDKLRRIRPSLANLGGVYALGYVAAEQVSLWLQAARLMLAPLIEGVSARKGTVMAALQHGQTVVTTRGIRTMGDIPWNEICLLAPLDREAFAALAVKAFHAPELRTVTGEAAKREYNAHASATVTASLILTYADQHDRAEAPHSRSRFLGFFWRQ